VKGLGAQKREGSKKGRQKMKSKREAKEAAKKRTRQVKSEMGQKKGKETSGAQLGRQREKENYPEKSAKRRGFDPNEIGKHRREARDSLQGGETPPNSRRKHWSACSG